MYNFSSVNQLVPLIMYFGLVLISYKTLNICCIENRPNQLTVHLLFRTFSFYRRRAFLSCIPGPTLLDAVPSLMRTRRRTAFQRNLSCLRPVSLKAFKSSACMFVSSVAKSYLPSRASGAMNEFTRVRETTCVKCVARASPRAMTWYGTSAFTQGRSRLNAPSVTRPSRNSPICKSMREFIQESAPLFADFVQRPLSTALT